MARDAMIYKLLWSIIDLSRCQLFSNYMSNFFCRRPCTLLIQFSCTVYDGGGGVLKMHDIDTAAHIYIAMWIHVSIPHSDCKSKIIMLTMMESAWLYASSR